MSTQIASQADLIVVGSGAAGLAAAVTAAAHGMSVIVVEKAPVVGGTTAWSGGWIWAPRNPLAIRAGIIEEPSAPRDYLKSVVGNRFDPDRIDAFLDAVPRMVAFFETRTALQFESGTAIPDTYQDVPGAGAGGRSVIAAPFDGRALGDAINLLRPPLPETSFHGMTIQSGPDLRAFLTMTRSMRAFWHVAKRVTRHVSDLAIHGRGLQLRNGNALVARLLRSAMDLGVVVRVDACVSDLIQDDDRVTGVKLKDGSILSASRGVVLSTGGFAHDAHRRGRVFARNAEHLPLSVPTTTGDGIGLAEGLGGYCTTSEASPAALCPVSKVPNSDGSEGRFPHIIDRGKPGVIAVLANGKRFCNEGLGYHDYVEALLQAVPDNQPARSWLICDHRFLRRYGLGIVRPAPVPFRHWLRNGYLLAGRTPEALAKAAGIDPEGLRATIEHWNKSAIVGEDPQFRRGTSIYMRLQGDPDHGPNPCIAPIRKPPFYAVEVGPGSFGTFSGIATDGHARVLDANGAPIAGLYAAGADAASIFGGTYPAGGINLGPAMTFGYIAGSHVAGVDP